jgi:hypothetical protein
MRTFRTFVTAMRIDAFSMVRANIGGTLFFKDFARTPIGVVNFSYGQIGLLDDDAGAWPTPGSLMVEGFIYNGLAGNTPTAQARLDWLSRMPRGYFRPQPYEQTVRVLRQMGYQDEARKVAIAEQHAIRRSGQLGPAGAAWNWFLYVTIGYGYIPWLSLVWIAAFIALGTIVFSYANRWGLMEPSAEWMYLDARYERPAPNSLPHQYPHFRSFIFSLDSFLPFVELHQKTYWRLHERRRPDRRYLYCSLYFALHTIAGWILTGIAIAGVTGLVKGE